MTKFDTLAKKFYEKSAAFPSSPFIPGKTRIPIGKAYYDHEEIEAVLESLLEGWLGLSEKGREFEKKISSYVGNRPALFVNSGSSANLLAMEGLKQCNNAEGGEIITPALTFPTTLNPIIQQGFTPVFADIDDTLNLSPDSAAEAVTPKTKGIVFPHILGNPANMDGIMKIAEDHGLFVLEDCCAALGSRYKGKILGSFGDAATFSFHPAHGITTGEGGAVVTSTGTLANLIRKKRDWGKDCTCPDRYPDIPGACGNRFSHDLGGIEYDHRYVYSEIGYNMKPLELQAAFGCVQMDRVESFNQARKRNFATYKEHLTPLSAYFSTPSTLPEADPVFMGLPLLIQDHRINRKELVLFLLNRKIDTRYLFAGNIIKQPAYKSVIRRISGGLEQTEKAAANGFWVGIHPGITEEMITFIVESLKEFCIEKGLF